MTRSGVYAQATQPPVAVIGVGNILMSDDGIGIHVIRALQRRRIPRRIELIDGGTGGLALLPLMRDREKVIIVDAVRLQAPPGAVYRWMPSATSESGRVYRSAHTEGIDEILSAGRALGILPLVICIGIVPAAINRSGTSLSPALRKQLPAIARAVFREGLQRQVPPGMRARARQVANPGPRESACWSPSRVEARIVKQ